jgi:RNA polymerase sigma-70 factor (TIGR02943 family)
MPDIVHPEKWVDEFGDYLFRFALMRTSNQTVAEDLVQDTFLSAYRAFSSFDGKSTVKTWLIKILKNKIIDYYRKAHRKDVHLESYDEKGAQDFEDNGYWKLNQAPTNWGDNPESALQQSEFFQVLKKCLSLLPGRLAHVFTMRQVDGYTADDICKELSISSSNLWVMLHRARAQLRKCLETNWFTDEK